MPRKKPEDLNKPAAAPAPVAETKPDAVVVSTQDSTTRKVKLDLEVDYQEIIETKQGLVTEFEIIMDTKSRNKYHIINRQLNYSNREQILHWDVKEAALEEKITNSAKKNIQKRPSITLQHEELDNWDDDGSDFV